MLVSELSLLISGENLFLMETIFNVLVLIDAFQS